MKHSLTLIVSIALFLVLDAFIFFTYQKNIQKSFEEEIEITFWKIEAKSSDLLSDLLHKYSKQVEQIRKKHRYVKQFIEHSPTDPLQLNLKPLYRMINKNLSPPPYNIYITDESLVIKNTTFKNDMGFDLTFAKDIFEKHFKEKTIGISTPLFETSTRSFFSYSDSYYTYNDNPKRGVLQLSYTYYDVNPRLHELWKIIRKNSMIQTVKAYTKLNNGFVIDIKLTDTRAYKPKLKEILDQEKEGKNIETLLTKKGLTKIEKKNSVYYFFSAKSPIDPNISILYYIEFSKDKLKKQLVLLYFVASFSTLLGLFILYMLIRLFHKEQRLVWQDFFIQSSMHQLKTPLTLIRINNEIQQTKYSITSYTKNIEAGGKNTAKLF